MNFEAYDNSSASTTERFTLDILAVSDESVTLFTWVFVAGLCQAIDIFGVGSNIVNIKCFVKLGFREPVNISFFALAICDLGCLLTQIGVNVGYTLYVAVPKADFEAMEITYLTWGMLHLSFSRVNCCITAIITLERCLCVTVPLKVNNIVTQRRMWILNSSVFTIFLLSGSPVFFVNKLGLRFSSAKNKTVLGLVPTTYKDIVEAITFAINSFLLPFVAFIIIIICTIILAVNLSKRTQWRKSATKTDLSTREQKVAKMVVMISALFIFCFIPISAMMLAMAFEPRLRVEGKYLNLTKVLGNIGLLLESVNSSMNCVIYYHMSKKYRDTFRSLLPKMDCQYKCKKIDLN